MNDKNRQQGEQHPAALPAEVTLEIRKSVDERLNAPLSAAILFQINKTVEERLTKLPGDTYQLIQKEIDNRVRTAEKFYNRLLFLAAGTLSVIVFLFYRDTSARVSESVVKELSSTETKKQVRDIATFFKDAQDLKNGLIAAANSGLKVNQMLTNRLLEVQALDKVVTYDSNGFLFIHPKNGILWTIGTDGRTNGTKYGFVNNHIQSELYEYSPDVK